MAGKHISGRDATAVATGNNDVGKQDTESMETTKSDEPTLSKGAQRMRLHRKRHRRGERSVRILLSPPEMESLVRRGYLDVQSQNDQTAIQEAVEWFVSTALFEPVKRNAK
jgi:hypothetical protein